MPRFTKSPRRNGSRHGIALGELLLGTGLLAVLVMAIGEPELEFARRRRLVAESTGHMHAYVVALEAYRQDHGGATPATAMNYWWTHRWNYQQCLTSPVAYMNAALEDPLSASLNLNGPDYFYGYALWDNNVVKAVLTDERAPGMWGPVGYADKSLLRVYIQPLFSRWKRGNANYILVGWGPSLSPDGSLAYDPTNGLLSPGSLLVYR